MVIVIIAAIDHIIIIIHMQTATVVAGDIVIMELSQEVIEIAIVVATEVEAGGMMWS